MTRIHWAWDVLKLPVLVATVVCLGLAIIIFRPWEHGRPGGDPSGEIRQSLQSLARKTVPPGDVILTSTYGPTWDSCDGRVGTFGWDPVTVIEKIRPSESYAAIAQQIAAAGWTQIEQSKWTQAMSDGRIAELDLVNDQGIYDFGFSAKPPGPTASGC